MREIKFRYWAGGDFYRGWICDVYSEENINQGGFLSQYTGLKDKNGKEIYEDDLLWIEGFGKQRVYFSGGAYWVGEMSLCDLDLKNSEVLGNYYTDIATETIGKEQTLTLKDIEKLRNPLILKDICPVCGKEVISTENIKMYKGQMVHYDC